MLPKKYKKTAKYSAVIVPIHPWFERRLLLSSIQHNLEIDNQQIFIQHAFERKRETLSLARWLFVTVEDSVLNDAPDFLRLDQPTVCTNAQRYTLLTTQNDIVYRYAHEKDERKMVAPVLLS